MSLLVAARVDTEMLPPGYEKSKYF